MRKTKKDGLEIYPVTSKGKRELRWRIRRNGRIIGASTEGYRNLSGLVKNLTSSSQMLNGSAIYLAINKYRQK